MIRLYLFAYNIGQNTVVWVAPSFRWSISKLLSNFELMNIKIFYLRAYFTYEVYSATSLEVANFGGFLSLFNSSNRSSVNAFTTTTKVKKKKHKKLEIHGEFFGTFWIWNEDAAEQKPNDNRDKHTQKNSMRAQSHQSHRISVSPCHLWVMGDVVVIYHHWILVALHSRSHLWFENMLHRKRCTQLEYHRLISFFVKKNVVGVCIIYTGNHFRIPIYIPSTVDIACSLNGTSNNCICFGRFLSIAYSTHRCKYI